MKNLRRQEEPIYLSVILPDLHWPALGIRVMSRETPCSAGLAQQSAAHCANRCPKEKKKRRTLRDHAHRQWKNEIISDLTYCNVGLGDVDCSDEDEKGTLDRLDERMRGTRVESEFTC
jgi:hypothetical protein